MKSFRLPGPLSPSLAACLLASAAVTACAPATHISTPDTRLPVAFETPKGTAINAALPEQALDKWWLLFDDAQLTSLVEAALTAAPDARSAAARLEEAEAVRSQALLPFLPQGNLSGTARTSNSRQTTSFAFASPGGQSTSYNLQFNPTWELDFMGARHTVRRRADADLADARFDVEASRLALAAQVASDLIQARSIAVQLADAQDNARITRSMADLGKRKSDYGFSPTSDTARLESTALSGEAEVARLDGALRGAKRTLLTLVGRGYQPQDSLTVEPRLAAAPQVPASTPGALLARRPDVRQAEARLESQTTTVKLDKLQLFPNLTLEPGISFTRSSGVFESTTRMWSMGLGATVPILDRPRLLAEIRAQNARAEQAAVAYEKAVQSAYADAENTLTTLQADQRRAELLTQAEARSRFAFDAADKGYRAGLTDLTTLLQAEQGWRQARAALTNVRTANLQGAVNAFKALGGGWTPSDVTWKSASSDIKPVAAR